MPRKECPKLPAKKERPYLPQSFKNVPNDHGDKGNAGVLATTAKTPLSEQGDVKEEGIDLLVMPDD